MSSDPILSALLNVPQDESERALAARYSPTLLFDTREPFLPLAAGYTIFRHNGTSSSFRRGMTINLTPPDQPPASFAIEYAIWWDWDIGHLYELEHVWVHVDDDGKVIRADASWHGGHHDMSHEGRLTLEGDHLTLYSEPGKHAFAPSPQWFAERRKDFKLSETKDIAGIDGILLAPYIADHVQVTPYKTQLVQNYLTQRAFEPAWEFTQAFHFTKEMMVPWAALCAWMPVRVNHVLEKLESEGNLKLQV